MKEFVISEVQAETAVLVGLITKMQDERKTNEYSMNWNSWLRQRGGSSETIYSEAGSGTFCDLRRQG